VSGVERVFEPQLGFLALRPAAGDRRLVELGFEVWGDAQTQRNALAMLSRATSPAGSVLGHPVSYLITLLA
jgi:hypothetical protein